MGASTLTYGKIGRSIERGAEQGAIDQLGTLYDDCFLWIYALTNIDASLLSTTFVARLRWSTRRQ